MSPIRVLLADPDNAFRDMLASSLAQQGFLVKCATSVPEACTLLNESWFHLAVLNMQMRDPNDQRDTSGLEILRDPIFQHIPKFVLTNHPTIAMTREVLRPGLTGVPLAVDFLGKDADLPSILAALQDTINKNVRVNWALKIRQNDATSILQLAQLVDPMFSHAQVAERAEELENLVRRACYSERQITLGRLLLRRPGYAVVELVAHANGARSMLLVCSQAGKTNVDWPASEKIGRLDLQSTQSSIHFTIQVHGIHYSPPLRTYHELFSISSTDDILSATGELLNGLFASWHGNQRQFSPPDRFEQLAQKRLELNSNELETRIAVICQTTLANGIARLNYDQRNITFHVDDSTSLTFPNPSFLFGRKSVISLSSPIACGLTHGRITGAAILIDASGQSWLIDWDRVGIGPIVLDYAALEMAIRLESMPGISLAQRFLLEHQLLESNPEEKVPDELIKALRCIQHIRQISRIDPMTYSMGLFYTALAKIASFNPVFEYSPDELAVYLHVLLLAALLLGQFMKTEKIPQQALDSLWIDLFSKEVWVEGKRVELTPQDLDILVYLYENAGKQRSRQQIINSAMQYEMDGTNNSPTDDQGDKLITEESRLNSAMSRLRLKIEPDPEKPKYLHTIRGYGYRLDV